MAAQIDWSELLEKKYPSYKVEVNAYLDSLEISSSNDVSIDKIYQAIRNDTDVNENWSCFIMSVCMGLIRMWSRASKTELLISDVLSGWWNIFHTTLIFFQHTCAL